MNKLPVCVRMNVCTCILHHQKVFFLCFYLPKMRVSLTRIEKHTIKRRTNTTKGTEKEEGGGEGTRR